MVRRLASAGAFLALAAIAFVLPTTSRASERKTLIIQGRTLDQDGFALDNVRVSSDGSVTTHEQSDGRGEFALRLQLPTVASLRKKPYEVRIRPQRGGWSFALPQGDAVIGLQISVTREADGIERAVARSNHPRVAAAAARAVGLDGATVSLAAVNFVGVPARQKGKALPAMPALGQVAKVALTGGLPQLEVEPGAQDLAADPAEGWPKPPAVTPIAPEPLAEATPAVPERRVSRPPPPPPPLPASSDPQNPRERARREWIQREIELAKIRSQVRAGDDAAAPVTHDTTPVRAIAAAPPPAAPREAPTLVAAAPRDVAAPAISSRTADVPAPPSLSRLLRLAGPVSTVPPKRRLRMPRPLVASGMLPVPRLIVPPRSGGAVAGRTEIVPIGPRSAQAEVAPGAAATERVSPVPDSRSPSRAGNRTLVAVLGAPREPGVVEGERRARGDASEGREPGEDDSRESSCLCRIEGWIVMPRTSAGVLRRVPAVISSAYGDAADTVMLSTGERSRFQLDVPCGPQRMRLRGLGHSLRVVESSLPQSFRCDESVRNLRIVVVPR